MRKIFFILMSASLQFGYTQYTDNWKYILIHTVSKQVLGFTKKLKLAEINKTDVNRLNEPLKALAAFYSALAGNNCDGKNCELTSALGLGLQGSDKHKGLINKWFPNDTIAKSLVAQNCFQSPSGSSHFTNYKSLIFEINKDTVIINFSIVNYDRGKGYLRKGQDKAIIKNNKIIVISRSSFSNKD